MLHFSFGHVESDPAQPKLLPWSLGKYTLPFQSLEFESHE